MIYLSDKTCYFKYEPLSHKTELLTNYHRILNSIEMNSAGVAVTYVDWRVSLIMFNICKWKKIQNKFVHFSISCFIRISCDF